MPRRQTAIPPANFAARNQELGLVLRHAREQHQRTQEECAHIVGTTRRRYGMIERGEVPVSVVEMEALMRFLQLSTQHIFNDGGRSAVHREVVVQAQPGEVVQLVVQVQG